jgi:SAM-dependent methyltransferase
MTAVMTVELPRLYTDLASWFHLLTHPNEYVEEAAAYRDSLLAAISPRPRTLLELGSGGGNNAFQLKRDFACTLSDLSPAMIEQSRRINPECAHVVGDMRTLRLDRQFDAVFVHDAVCYLTTEEDLRRCVETAYVHTRPGGAALSLRTSCASAPSVVHDRHVEGLFARETWLRLLRQAGFEVRRSSRPNDAGEPDEVFVGVRVPNPATAG